MLAKYATTDEKRATLRAEFARYRAGYRTRTLAHLAAKSRTMSTMITGGSNFPTRRNAKRGAVADKRCDDLIEYRERAGDGFRIEENRDENRVQIIFPGKPSEEVRSKLKGCGFKWAPSQGAWQRQLNSGAWYAATRAMGVTEKQS